MTEDSNPEVLNTVHGVVTGNVVQAQSVSGGIHFHHHSDDAPWLSRRAVNLPARNPVFTGRAEILDAIRHELVGTPERAQAICGLGGVGKTQLALEYAHRHSADYGVLWWVVAEEPPTVRSALARLGDRLGAPSDSDEGAVVAWTMEVLQQRRDWLLVFDNAENAVALEPWRPPGQGHVIITSRNPRWRRLGTVRRLAGFSRAEATSFVTTRTEGASAEEVNDLCEALGDLPLALEQAAAYIEETGITLPAYHRLFRERRHEMLKRGDVVGYRARLDTVWELSFERVERDSAHGTETLRLCAFLAPDGIPLAVLPPAQDELVSIEAISSLRNTSLVRQDGDGLSVHRLVQLLVRKRLPLPVRREYVTQVLGMLTSAFPGSVDSREHWPTAARLVPHVYAVARHAEELHLDDSQLSVLFRRTAYYLWVRGDVTSAQDLLERALALDEKIFGPDSEELLSTLALLASLLADTQDFERIRSLLTRGLEIATLHGDQTAVADYVGELGELLLDQGELDDATTYLEEALRIRQELLEPGHPRIAWCHNGLGSVQRARGDLTAARDSYNRALEIAEQLIGGDRILIAWTLNDLGDVLRRQGNLDDARTAHERALGIASEQRGEDSLDAAASWHKLGEVSRDAGDLERARAEFEEALRLRRVVLAPTHRHVAETAAALDEISSWTSER